MSFYIKEKREFLLTYANDWEGELTIPKIMNMLEYKFPNMFEYIVSKETGHEEGDKHDHFHVYLRYRGKAKNGFTCRGKAAATVFDVILEDGTVCHPNIKFKGDKDDENCKNTTKMMSYVTKQRVDLPKEHWRIESNFNWEPELEELLRREAEREQRQPPRRRFVNRNKDGTEEDTKDSLEYDFCMYLLQVVNDGRNLTAKEIINEIKKNKDHWYVFASKYPSYSKFLNEMIKHRSIPKPRMDYNHKFIIPRVLRDYIEDVLDPWVEAFYTKPEEKVHRCKGLWLTGKSRSGKTSLMILLGSCSYFKNIWNFYDYESQASFNIFDDFDNEITDINSFNRFKPWIGSQDTMCVTDKWVKKTDIVNGKPLIFINNNKLEDLVTYEPARRYIHQNMEVVELGDKDLYSIKDKRTIGGWQQWVEYDPKTCWYYKNIIAPLEEAVEIVEEIESDPANLYEGKGKEPEDEPDVIEISSTLEPEIITDYGTTSNAILIKDEEADIEEPFVYAEELPGYEDQLFKNPRLKRKNENGRSEMDSQEVYKKVKRNQKKNQKRSKKN